MSKLYKDSSILVYFLTPLWFLIIFIGISQAKHIPSHPELLLTPVPEGFVLVKGGCYQMGDIYGDGLDSEKPVHEVCLDDFYLLDHEVTQGEWEEVMGKNPSLHKSGSNYPVEMVSWNDIQEYINKISQKRGKKYRLPTEAEWEYAARSGGKNHKYSWGNGKPSGKNGGNIADASAKREDPTWVSWDDYDDSFGLRTAPVKSYLPNELGLYDMTGNVWEWCSDWHDEEYYSKSPKDNPKGPTNGSWRVLRGGAWGDDPFSIRIPFRLGNDPSAKSHFGGFRLVFMP